MAPFSQENLDLLDSSALDAVSQQGEDRYAVLKTQLEPHHNGETVAIHLGSGDYAIGQNSPEAMRLLRRQHPTGLMVTIIIGPDQMDQFAYRLLGNTRQAKAQK